MNSFVQLQSKVEKLFIKKYILKSNSKQDKAIKDCSRQFTSSLIYHEINFDFFIHDYENDNIITDMECFYLAGTRNWNNCIKPTYLNFAKDLFSLRPTGLGTPNSAVGEGEFMLICLSPKISKPKKGDIQFHLGTKKVAEIKNSESRVFSPINGIDFNSKCLMIAKNHGFQPNSTKNKFKGQLRYGVELAEESKKSFYDSQFSNFTTDKKIQILSEWFLATDCFTKDKSLSSSKVCFDEDGKLIPYQIQKEILKAFNRKDLESRDEFDVKLFFSQDMVTVIDKDPDSFDNMVNNNLIKPIASYFRIFQKNNLGWYYKNLI